MPPKQKSCRKEPPCYALDTASQWIDKTSSAYTTSIRHEKGLLRLPTELKMHIFVMAQNTEFPTVSSEFWNISLSPLVRAHYLVYRFGLAAALGGRGMRYKIVNVAVIDSLLALNCSPRADGDWLFWAACEKHNTRICKLVLDAIQPTQKMLSHFLNVASMKGSIPIIDLLVEEYGAVIHTSSDESLVIVLACAENRVSLVQHLISRYHCNVHGHDERHLRRACLNGYDELVDLLLVGANVHAYTDAAIQSASHKGHLSIVKRLLAAGADPQANRNAPIRYAIKIANAPLVECLLKAGANPHCDNDWPIKHTCRLNLSTILSHLIDNGLDPNYSEGMPLWEAITGNSHESIELLLKASADPNSLGALRATAHAIKTHRYDTACIMVKAGIILDHPEIVSCFKHSHEIMSCFLMYLEASARLSRERSIMGSVKIPS
ncbi:ankyrin repeat-containing domain protein [Spinellus fusiger]|nr:ankyrin repeat-containing domain protein [Spinellus fusiger]